MAFDLETETISGTLKFDGPPPETDCGEPASDVYWVIAKEPDVAVYFGDTDEVIIFEEQPAP